MKHIKDYQGLSIRLTEERMKHILEHPEMKSMSHNITETLSNPDCVLQSANDQQTELYYRYYLKTKVGDKFLCVVVKKNEKDAFVITAYLTDKIKKGNIIWIKKE